MKRFTMYLYALLRCLYIFTIGYFFKKNRKLISNMCEIFGYQQLREFAHPEIRTTIPKIEIASLVNDNASIILPEVDWKDGNVSLLELSVIIKMVKQFDPKRIFEIGTFDGRTTLGLACNSADDAIIYTLDLPKKENKFAPTTEFTGDKSFVNKAVTGSRFQGKNYVTKIRQLFGDSATFDFSPYENRMDLVFIDGSHTYKYILTDTEKAFKLLKDGRGVILWHDYSWVWPDVARALNKLYTANSRLNGIKHIQGTSLVCYVK